MSTEIPGDAGFLCQKAGVLFAAINERPDIIPFIRR